MNNFILFFILIAFIAMTSGEYQKLRIPMATLVKGKSVFGKRISAHIIDGTPATLGQFPWQAALVLTKSTVMSLCGGSLIHVQWIATAAHCTINTISVSVRLGTLNYDEGGSEYIVNNPASIITHANFTASNANNDIGLIKLPSAVTQSTNIKVIRLLPSAMAFSTLTVSGWGKTCDSCYVASQLMSAVVSAITNTNCSNIYGSNVVTSNTVCTIGSAKQSPCSGDSGGPLVITGTTPYLVGIVSFNSAAGCELRDPAGYVRINKYCSWIKARISGFIC